MSKFLPALFLLAIVTSCNKSGKFQVMFSDATNETFTNHGDSIDYCTEQFRLKKWRTVTGNTPEDSVRAYGIAMANCLLQKIVQHNNDSLTTDTCLCRQRLKLALSVDFDSTIISFKPNKLSKITNVTIRPNDPNIIDGINSYEIDDSCRILGFDTKKKRN